jgi:hypothetical protein
MPTRPASRPGRPPTSGAEKVYHIASLSIQYEDIMLNLKDPTLLRQQAYIDGEWCTRHRRCGCRLARLAQENREGTRRHPAQVE